MFSLLTTTKFRCVCIPVLLCTLPLLHAGDGSASRDCWGLVQDAAQWPLDQSDLSSCEAAWRAEAEHRARKEAAAQKAAEAAKKRTLATFAYQELPASSTGKNRSRPMAWGASKDAPVAKVVFLALWPCAGTADVRLISEAAVVTLHSDLAACK